MKKLTLNKKTIAQLDNTENIVGGMPPTWGQGVAIPASAVTDCNAHFGSESCAAENDCGGWCEWNIK